MASLGQLLNRLKTAKEAPRPTPLPVAQPAPLDEAALKRIEAVPAQLRNAVPRAKLAAQTAAFAYPEWAALPSAARKGCRLEVTKDGGLMLRPIMLDAFPVYLLGKDRGICDVVLDHQSISRVHLALIHHNDGRLIACDVNSSNGVTLNGRRVPKQQFVAVEEGDELVLGASSRTYTVRLSGADLLASKATYRRPQVVVVSPESASSVPASAGARRERDDEIVVAPAVPSPAAPVVSTVAETSVTVPEAAPSPAPHQPQVDRVALAHILLRHVELPPKQRVSRAPRNKGEPITRSPDEALQAAAALRELIIGAGGDVAEAFQRHVAEFSECQSAGKNGALGTVERGDLASEVEDVVFALPVQGVSQPVLSQQGVHLFMRLE